MMQEEATVCSIAQHRHRKIALWRDGWTLLLWVFGLTVIIVLIAGITFFIREDWISGGLATITFAAQGGAIKWITTRRADAVREEEEAFNRAEQACR